MSHKNKSGRPSRRRSLSQIDDGVSDLQTVSNAARSSTSSRRSSLLGGRSSTSARPNRRKRRSSLLGTPARSGTPSRSVGRHRRSSIGGRDTPSILGNVWQTNYMPERERIEVEDLNTLLARTLKTIKTQANLKRNLWEFKLPSYLQEVVERESTFVERATGIDASSRIIAHRIDWVHAKGEKVLANLNKSDMKKIQSEEQKEEAKRKRRIKNTITIAAPGSAKIRKSLKEELKSFDPLYEKHACSLMAGSVDNILLKVLPTNNGCLMFGGESKLQCYQQASSAQPETMSEGDTSALGKLRQYVGERLPQKSRTTKIMDMSYINKMIDKFKDEKRRLQAGEDIPDSDEEMDSEEERAKYLEEEPAFKPDENKLEEEIPEPKELEEELKQDLALPPPPGPLSSQGSRGDARSAMNEQEMQPLGKALEDLTDLVHRPSFGIFSQKTPNNGWEGPLFRKGRDARRRKRLKRYRDEFAGFEDTQELARCKKRKKKPMNFIDFFNDFFADEIDASKFTQVPKKKTQVSEGTKNKWKENQHCIPPDLKVKPIDLTKDTWRPQDNIEKFRDIVEQFRPDLDGGSTQNDSMSLIPMEGSSDILPDAGPGDFEEASQHDEELALPPEAAEDPLLDDDEFNTQSQIPEMDPSAFQSLFGDLLASKPFRRRQTDKIDFRKEHGDVDVGQVKRAIFKIMERAPLDPKGSGIRKLLFGDLANQMMTTLGRKTALRITTQVLFVCLLYSCNDFGLELEGDGVEMCDLMICTTPEFPLKRPR